MRDKIFETSAGLSVTGSESILEAKEAGSSVSLSWTAFFFLLLICVAVLVVAPKVLKKGGDAGKDMAKK